MATDVVMPQMGESVAEGTVVRWMKKVGDRVDRDEPLFEISTDKVDAEIPSPVAGVLAEIRVQEGETVAVNSVVAVIGPAGEATTSPPGAAFVAAATAAAPPPAPAPQPDGSPAPAQKTAAPPDSPAPPAKAGDAPAETTPAPASAEGPLRQRSSPLVRRMAKEHNVDISQIRGTGIAGRVTKDDILQFIESRSSGQAGRAGRPAAPDRSAPSSQAPSGPSAEARGLREDRVEKMSVMRKKIAEHMMLSRRTSAHVHSVFEVNFSRVAQIRHAKRSEYERAGTKLTYLPFIVKAVAEQLGAMPILNTSIDGDHVVYHKEINIGIAVALDWGLIVPVIENADKKNLLGLSRAITDLADRARAKQLKPDEVSGGTFTITNPGILGALFGMPIINQPQVAILGVGAVEKRAVVIDDAIAIRPMAYLTLGYDHRLIDGAVADEFMSRLKHAIENWDPAAA